jgi:uncharacterized membrane protein YhaH (DUF805 family)
MSETVIMNPFKLLWSFDGRIGRAAYAGGSLLNLVLMIIAVAIVEDLNRGWRLIGASSRMQDYLLPLLAVVVFFIWATLALTAKRIQDLGYPGAFSAFLLVPGIGLIVIIIALIARGEGNDNRYGPGAPSTSTPAPAHHT